MAQRIQKKKIGSVFRNKKTDLVNREKSFKKYEKI